MDLRAILYHRAVLSALKGNFASKSGAGFSLTLKSFCKGDCPAASMFLKYMINTSYHSRLKQTPYKLVFDQRHICRINILPFLPDDFSRAIRTEGDLCKSNITDQDVDLSQIRIVPVNMLSETESITKPVLFTAPSKKPLLQDKK